MSRRLFPVALVLGALLGDAADHRSLAFYLLIAAVPAAAVSTLSVFGDLVEMPRGAAGATRARILGALDALGLVLIVLAAAVRGQSVDQGHVPALGVSAVVACLVVFGVQALAALAAWTPDLSPAVRLGDEEAAAGAE